MEDRADGLQQSFHISLLYDDTCIFRDSLYTSSGPISHYRCSAGYRFQVDCRIVVLPSGIHKHIGRRIKFPQLTDILCSGYPQHMRRQHGHLLFIYPYQHPLFIPVQPFCQFHEIIPSFFYRPNACHSQKNAFSLQLELSLHFLGIIRFENRRIDAVMNHTELIILEERALHLTLDPMRYGHNGEPILGDRSKCLLLVTEVLSRAVCPPA